MVTVLIILAVLMLLGVIPVWPHSRWGCDLAAARRVVLIVVILLLAGRI
jgi:hypothetical protein